MNIKYNDELKKISYIFSEDFKENENNEKTLEDIRVDIGLYD